MKILRRYTNNNIITCPISLKLPEVIMLFQISFARCYLSTSEVEELYASKGACIGE